jgi:hypothetical protein
VKKSRIAGAISKVGVSHQRWRRQIINISRASLEL